VKCKAACILKGFLLSSLFFHSLSSMFGSGISLNVSWIKEVTRDNFGETKPLIGSLSSLADSY